MKKKHKNDEVNKASRMDVQIVSADNLHIHHSRNIFFRLFDSHS